jgi:5-methylcytosine-specific restriction endonuclease McrA
VVSISSHGQRFGVTLRDMSSSWTWPPGWRRLRAATFARYGRQCWWCGAYATTVDHVVAVVLGGGHDPGNLRPACQRCNYSRGAALGNRLRPPRPLSPAQRRAIALKRAQPVPQQQTWRTSRRW